MMFLIISLTVVALMMSSEAKEFDMRKFRPPLLPNTAAYFHPEPKKAYNDKNPSSHF